MDSRITIKEKLQGKFKLFLQYCAKTGKEFLDELKPEDFIAYRRAYFVPRAKVEELKNFLAASEENFSTPALKEYFNIENPALYKNIFVQDLDFNGRVKNMLQQINCNTLFELLNHSTLENLKGLGEGSFKNIIKTLHKFFNSQNFRQMQLKQKFFSLPENIKTKKLLPFVQAYNVAENNFQEDIPAEITVADFPKYLINNPEKYALETLKNFSEWLDFDLNSTIESGFDKIINADRNLSIFYERSDGKTLKEISKQFRITLELTRQIEAKAIKKFASFYLDTRHDIFIFMRALNEGKNILTFEDAEKILGVNYSKIIWNFLPKLDFSKKIYSYSAELDVLIFNFESTDSDSDIDAFIKNLPQIMPEDTFCNTIKNFAQKNNFPEKVLYSKFLKLYQHTGKIFHRNRITLAFQCEYIFKEKFQNGYKISNNADYLKFNHFMQEIFSNSEKITQRSIDAKITAAGVLCERGKYIHPDFVDVPPKIINLIKNFIASSNKNVLSFKEIFAALKAELIDTQIDNPYFLQGVIKLNNFPYTLRKDYLTKNTEMNFAEEFTDFVKAAGEVSISEIKEHFISLNNSDVSNLIMQCPEIIRIDEGNFLHSSRLNLQEKDFVDIEKFLRQVCKNLPVSSRSLFNSFSEKFFYFITRNEIYDHEKLFGILRYMFKDKFNFTRPYIAPLEIQDITNKKVLLLHLREFEKIDIEDLLSICDEQGINYTSENPLVESLRPEFIKVDEFSIMRPEILGINEEIISAVCQNLRAAIVRNGGWQSAKTFSDYEWLPRLKISWNSFLLESVAALADEKISVLKNPSQDTNFSAAIFIGEDFAEENFNSFVLRILISEHGKQPFQSEAEILEWLQENGICNKTLPKFLKSEGHIEFNFYGELFLNE